MVHISDGLLSFPVLLAGWIATLAIVSITLWWSKRKGKLAEEIPKMSVVTAAFFVASLVHIPVGPTSVHLILNGLVGVTLGILSYPAIFIGLTLQAFLFGHGGVTVLGINTFNIGIPALIAYGIFRAWKHRVERLKVKTVFLGAIAGGTAVTLAVLLTAVTLSTLGEGFTWVVNAIVVYHIPVIVVESIVVGSTVAFLSKVKPELLEVKG